MSSKPHATNYESGIRPNSHHGLADTRQRLLEAGEKVFERLGYTRATMGDIAAQSGVSRPTVYAYFSSKEDVFRAAAIAVRDEFLRLQEVDPELGAIEILRHTLSASLETWIGHLGLLTVVNHQALSDPEMSQLWNDIHHWPNRRHVRFIERLASDGSADPLIPPAAIAEAITGVTRRFAEHAGAPGQARTELTDQLITIYFQLAGIPAN